MTYKCAGGVAALLLTLSVTTPACQSDRTASKPDRAAVQRDDGLLAAGQHRAAYAYADLALSAYADALADAQALEHAIVAFTTRPSEAGLERARGAWLAARMTYAQTEAFRFGGGPIDDLERRIDAWPVDESLIDYVAGDPCAGIINDSPRVPTLSAQQLLAMNEREGETSVTTGYHAIEFLLWGQDLSATGPGARPARDYMPGSANASRRGVYLKLAAALLVRDLGAVVQAWSPNAREGYRNQFLAAPAGRALAAAWLGVHRFLSSELAGERLTVGYETKDQEDETSCFSDNTLNDILFALVGVDNLLRGRYGARGATQSAGPGLEDLVAMIDPSLAQRLRQASAVSIAAVRAIPAPFDRAIRGEDSWPGRRAVAHAIAAVRAEAEVIDQAMATLNGTDTGGGS